MEISKENSMVELNPQMIENMEQYINQAKLRQTTLTYIASRIPESQITDLKAAFQKFDANGDGQLSHEELKTGIASVPQINLSLDDI